MARSRNVYTSSAILTLIPLHSKTLLLWRLNIAGSNRTYLSLRVKCPIFLSDFNQIWIFRTPISNFTQKILPVGSALIQGHGEVMGTGGQDVKLTTHLHPVPKLRSGAIRPLPPYAITACKGLTPYVARYMNRTNAANSDLRRCCTHTSDVPGIARWCHLCQFQVHAADIAASKGSL